MHEVFQSDSYLAKVIIHLERICVESSPSGVAMSAKWEYKPIQLVIRIES